MKHFIYLLIMAAIVCCAATAFATDFADDTFGILNEKQKKALNELDISSELKKADAAADTHDFDKAKEICQKLLKQSDLSSQDKSLIQAKLDAVENKRSDYVAQKKREEERKKAEALAQTAREEESRKQADHAALIEKSRIESEQERQRLLNAKGSLVVTISFKAGMSATPRDYTLRIRRVKDIFGEPDYNDLERKTSGYIVLGTETDTFVGLRYGLYEVKMTVDYEFYDLNIRKKVKRRADRTLNLVVNSYSNIYYTEITEDDIEVRRIK